jgi:predicted CXXCH cytochrome family protein
MNVLRKDWEMYLHVVVVMFLLLLASSPLPAQQGMAIDPATCLGCHSDRYSIKDFAASVHGKNACTSCHTDITDLIRHMKKEIKVQKVQCERCHKREDAEHYASVHTLRGIRCASCHTDIHTHTYWNKDKRIVVARCLACHDKQGAYRKSTHGKAVAAGNSDSAACHDCHNLHDIKPLGAPGDHANREFHTKVCLKCHSDAEMMKRNKVFNVAVKTYMESYHGKNYRLGSPERAAGCSDCHTAHFVLPSSDPASSTNPANILGTCSKCHKKATVSFTKFYAHGEPTDRQNYPILFYTFVGMTTLLVSVFIVFWVHTLFWLFRGYIENHHKKHRNL